MDNAIDLEKENGTIHFQEEPFLFIRFF